MDMTLPHMTPSVVSGGGRSQAHAHAAHVHAMHTMHTTHTTHATHATHTTHAMHAMHAMHVAGAPVLLDQHDARLVRRARHGDAHPNPNPNPNPNPGPNQPN